MLQRSRMAKLQRRLGKAIRRARTAAGYSQEAFAVVVGTHRTYMGQIERGRANVSLDILERVAGALKIPVSALIAQAEGEGRRSASDSA
jgi:transcriptional regulator with XRE-family HTH domain